MWASSKASVGKWKEKTGQVAGADLAVYQGQSASKTMDVLSYRFASIGILYTAMYKTAVSPWTVLIYLLQDTTI